MIKIHAHSLAITADQRCWSLAQSLHAQSQTAVLVLSLCKEDGDDALDLASIGGVVFEKFHENGNSFVTSSQWYDWAKTEVTDLVETGLKVSILIAVVEDSRLWMWGSGETTGVMVRASNFARLVGTSGFGEGVAGVVMDQDVIVLGTNTAANYVLDTLTQTDSLATESVHENLAPGFYAQDNASNQAMVILRVEEESEKVVSDSSHFKFPSLTIKRSSEEPRRYNLVFGGIVIGLLILLVLIGVVSRSRRLAESAYETASEQAQTMLSDAENVAGTNPERAKILLAQSKDILTRYIQTKPKADYARKIEDQLRSITEKESEILRVRGIRLSPTIELSLLSEGLQAKEMQSDAAGSLYFWDTNRRTFAGVNVVDLSKVSFEVASERYVTPFAVSSGVYTGIAESGVWRGSKSDQKVVIERDETWGNITQVATFGNNIYLLDTSMGEIWKYAATDDGYADRRRWFGAGIILDLSKVVDWVVDGDVWLLTSSGKLERYSRGAPVNFALTGFPSESETGGFVDPVALTMDNEVVYVLEKGASRVVAISIDGKYVEQYVSEDFGRASDIMVYEGKGYVLVDNVVKEWGL